MVSPADILGWRSACVERLCLDGHATTILAVTTPKVQFVTNSTLVIEGHAPDDAALNTSWETDLRAATSSFA